MMESGLAELVKETRESLNITQEEVAEKLGINRTTLSRWESGEIDNIKIKYIPKLAEILNLPAIAFIYPMTYKENNHLDIKYLNIASKLQKNNVDIEDINSFIDLVNNIKSKSFIDIR